MCNKYNGWSNYPTWNWKLWMDNSPNDWDDRCQEIYDEAEASDYLSKLDVATKELEDLLKAECEEYYEEFVEPSIGNAGAFTDIFGWALEMIDFYEIAENMMSGVDQEKENDEIEDEEAELEDDE